MIDVAGIQNAFPELSGLQLHSRDSGQKFVLKATGKSGPVVLKLFKKGTVDAPRAEREIQAVALLDSPRVPKIHDFGTRVVCGTDELFLIEEFVDGTCLRDCLLAKGRLPFGDVLHLVHDLILACQDLEQKRLVHRDLKPDNVILGTGNTTWVIDLGIVRHLDLGSLTSDGIYHGLGTLGYSAPEQFQNVKAEINVRADLFAVGAIAYECLAGFNPYLKDLHTPGAVLQRMETADMPPLQIPEDITKEFSPFISALIQRYPSRRPQTAAEAIAWLEPVLKQTPRTS